MIPTKNIDIVLFEARGWFCRGDVDSVSLYTSNACYDLDRYNVIDVENATESDFTELFANTSNQESFYAILEKDVLKKVYEAESLSIRVTQKDYPSYKVISFDDKKKYYMSPQKNLRAKLSLEPKGLK